MAARLNPLPTSSSLLAAAFLLAIFTPLSGSREIRPSDHGLSFQKSPSKASPAMAAFFKGAPSSSSSSTPSDVALPVAKNSSDPFWNQAMRGRGEGGRHVRWVLLVTTLACGVVGFSLMLAAAFVYFFRVRTSK